MKGFLFMCLLVFPAIILTLDNGSKLYAFAAEDELEDELVDVEGENDESSVVGEDVADDEGAEITASPFADTVVLFTKPTATGSQLEFPAGKLVEFLVGFTNKGEQDFTLETLEASFRYPMDFNYHIQNFSTLAYNRVVAPKQESTLVYSFVPADAFAGRPFGLNVILSYRDASGASFYHAVYNETVQITEVEEGLDGETFFLYVFLVGLVVLLLVLGQQFLISKGGKRTSSASSKRKVETGTKDNPNDVDFDWLPKETLNQLSKSPKQTKQSPRQRKVKRSVGSDD
uniref:Translocon-associated protein subunit alpha n=1 Tax=Xenopsylla cheopis TaxID=163159 RepID=A0A6M2DWN9_XENCH